MSVSRRSVILAVILLALLAVFPVFASGGEGIKEFCINMLESIFDMDALTGIATTLTTDLASTYSNVWALTQNLVDDVITPLAYSILGIYLILTVINVGMRPEGATAVQFMKPFVWFVAAAILVKYTPNIIANVVSAVGYVAGDVVDAASAADLTTDVVSEYTEYLDGYITGLASGFVVVGQLLIPWLAAKFANIVIWFMAYAAIMELFIRGIFLPLSYGPMIMHGFDHQGTRYLRSFIACGLRIVLMVASGIMVSYFMTSLLTSDSPAEYASATIRVVFILLAFVVVLKKCGDIANDVMGV